MSAAAESGEEVVAAVVRARRLECGEAPQWRRGRGCRVPGSLMGWSGAVRCGDGDGW